MQKMNYTKFIIVSSVCVLMITVAQSGSAADRYYVNDDAKGANNGSSWANAYTDLQSALSVADSGDEIWVAKGTYKPSVEHYYYDEPGGSRYRSFQMKNGVGIYGGFAGNETSRGQRNPTLHVTILSGDIGTVGNNSDNCYHVFYHQEGLNLNSTAVLDGFTIRDGYANGPVLSVAGTRHRQGAGMYSIKSSATIANCIFTNNIAAESGGAMFHHNCTVRPDCTDLPLTVTNCTFSNNSVVPIDVPDANKVGGGVYTVFTTATFTNCTFTGNTSYDGGAMYHFQSSITLTNCTFSSNSALVSSANPSSTGIGGGIFFDECMPSELITAPTITTSNLINSTFSNNSAQHSGGAIFNYKSSPTITDCTISGNSSAKHGGGMVNEGGSDDGRASNPTLLRTKFFNNSAGEAGGAISSLNRSAPIIINSTFSGNSVTGALTNGGALWNSTAPAIPQIVNSTFSGNTAIYAGGAIFNQSSSPMITNSILWGNSGAVGAQIFNNTGSAPVVTYSNVQGGYSGTGNLNGDPLFVNAGNKDFHLQPTSPCIDQGNNAVSNLPTTDFEGDNRIIDGNGDGIAVADMGVDEFVPPRSYLLWTK